METMSGLIPLPGSGLVLKPASATLWAPAPASCWLVFLSRVVYDVVPCASCSQLGTRAKPHRAASLSLRSPLQPRLQRAQGPHQQVRPGPVPSLLPAVRAGYWLCQGERWLTLQGIDFQFHLSLAVLMLPVPLFLSLISAPTVRLSKKERRTNMMCRRWSRSYWKMFECTWQKHLTVGAWHSRCGHLWSAVWEAGRCFGGSRWAVAVACSCSWGWSLV